MTYKHLIKYLIDERETDPNASFDLSLSKVKSKIIFIVGKNRANAAAFLSSIMTKQHLSHSRYISSEKAELKDKFINNGTPVSINEICSVTDKIIRKYGKNITKFNFLMHLSLYLLKEEYILLELSDDEYEILSEKVEIIPFACIFCTLNDALNSKNISFLPCGVSEIITLSEKENCDYVSAKRTANGTRISYVSKNKLDLLRSNVFGTDFYYFSRLFHISAIDQNNALIACVAIESAKLLFKSTNPIIYQGLEKAKIPNDLELFSIDPIVLLREGENDFSLYHKMKFSIIIGGDLTIPSENTIFCGSAKYISKVREFLNKK